MNSKSIRLEALRFASALDPDSASTLIGSADSIEQFIQQGSPRVVSENPLNHVFRTLERIEGRLLNWSPAEQASIKAKAEGATQYDPDPVPEPKSSRGAKPLSSRTRARK